MIFITIGIAQVETNESYYFIISFFFYVKMIIMVYWFRRVCNLNLDWL